MNSVSAVPRGWPNTLAAKFLLVVLFGVLIPLGLVGIWLTQSAQRSGRELLLDQLNAAGDVLAADVTRRWELREGELALLANNSVTTALLAGTPLTATDSAYLSDLVRAVAGAITSVSMLDSSDRQRWNSDGLVRATASLPRRAPGSPDDARPLTSDRARVDAPSQTLLVDRAIVADGRRIGTLAARVRLSSVVQLDSLETLSPGAALVIREGEQLLWASSSAVPDARDSTALQDWEVVRRSIAGPALHLEVVAPSAPFVRPFEEAARTGLGVLALVALFAMLLTLVMTRRITRSLQALSAAAAQVAAGELDVSIEVESNDEAGRVGVAFNRMTESLRGSLAELAHQRSLAAVGEFAASLSHEVRNSLTAVRVDLQHANRHLESEHPGRPLVSRTLDSVRQLDATVTSALRMARGAHVQRAPVSLRDVLDRAMRAAQPTFSERGAVLESLAAAPMPVVSADAAALEALFLNALLNAAQALRKGGAARVEVSGDGDIAIVRVIDNGGGVPAHALSSVGTPFHSSKPNGTGLGLPIARRIAESHGGALRVESAEGKGTTVVVTLPIASTISSMQVRQ